MRDLLTILAGLLVVALTAALAVPPLVEWQNYRGFVDGAIARAVGQEVASDGALEVRLLPVPRLKMDRLRIGARTPDTASLDAMFVRAEIALAPLLSGELRLLDARIGRAELTLPTGPEGAWRVPSNLLGGRALGRGLVLEDLRIAQLLLTTVEPRTGRTDQAYAEGVRVRAASPTGPWRVDGTGRGDVPFELVVGEVGPDGATTVKLGGGGATRPRFEVDGRLSFSAGDGGGLRPRLAGTARLVSPPRPADGTPPAALPFSAMSGFEAADGVVRFDPLSAEIGGGPNPLRLSGSGRLAREDGRLTLALSGRRADLAALVADAGGPDLPRLEPWREALGLPAEISLRLDGAGIGADEDLTGLELRLGTEPGRLRIEHLAFRAPGGTEVTGRGEVVLGAVPSAAGRLAVRSGRTDRLATFLASAGFPDLSALLDGRPLDGAADVTLADPVISLRNLRVALGETTVSGTLRYTEPDGGARGRVDAQLAVTGLDLRSLPDAGPAFAAAGRLDLGLSLDAREIGYGSARGGGRIVARIVTDGPAILFERLEIADLAGAEGSLSGRISPDGTGRIAGRLRARRAAPLIDLFGRAWLGGAIRLVPTVLHDGSLDLAVELERAAGAANAAAEPLRTRLLGTLAGGPFEATTVSSDGVLRSLSVGAGTSRVGSWLGLPDPARLARPGRLTVSGRRDGAGRLLLDVRGDVAGLRLSTPEPIRLGPADEAPEAGTLAIEGEDVASLLAAFGDGLGQSPVPVSLRFGLSGEGGRRLSVAGRAAGASVSAELDVASPSALFGRVALGRLSLPWLASALALGGGTEAGAGAIWPTARFGRRPELGFGGTLDVTAETLGLGAAPAGENAAFRLATSPDGFAVSGLAFRLAGGRVGGSFTLARQGGLASLIGEGTAEGLALPALLGPPFVGGSLSAALRFGASGENVAGLVGNLGGAGRVTLTDLVVENADPAGVTRAAIRALRSDDPLAGPRLAAVLAEEIGRGPLRAGAAGANGSLSAGALRLTPLTVEGAAGSWRGSATVDLRTLSLEARGSLLPAEPPRGWSAQPPAAILSWTGPLARPVRAIDPGPLVNSLAAVVLQRELDRIEVFELDAAERGRLNARVDMDRRRQAAAEEAARQQRLREEAAERARQEEEERRRQEAERQRQESERQRQEAERQRQASEPPPAPPRPLAPLDIRPPAQSGAAAGG